MPVLWTFGGINICIFPYDHTPPHLHIRGNQIRAKINIEDYRIEEDIGKLSPKTKKVIKDWVSQERDSLMTCWEQAQLGEPIIFESKGGKLE